MQFIVSYSREANHRTDHGMVGCERCAIVAFGRGIWRLPAVTQAYCILESILVEGKAMIIQWQNIQPRRRTFLFFKVNIAIQLGGEVVVKT